MLCAHESDGGLAIADLATHCPLIRFRERHPVNLDDLGVLQSCHRRLDSRREV